MGINLPIKVCRVVIHQTAFKVNNYTIVNWKQKNTLINIENCYSNICQSLMIQIYLQNYKQSPHF